MKNYRSAMGKNVDMAALVAKNENVRAVGNHPVNARGDTIDSYGRVVKPVTAKVNQSYNKTVGNKSANAVKQAPSKQAQVLKPQISQELTEAERELEDSFDDDLEVEAIKAKEQGKK
jgi:hypothetical protein